MKYRIEYQTREWKGRRAEYKDRVKTLQADSEDAARSEVKALVGDSLVYINRIEQVYEAPKPPTLKELESALPHAIFAKVSTLAKDRHCKPSFEQRSEGDSLYFDEGADYWIALDGANLRHARTDSEMGMTASKTNALIGNSQPMPAGAWVIEYKLFLGHPLLSVTHYGLRAMGA